MNRRRIEFFILMWVVTVLTVVSVCQARILGLKTLEVDFTNTASARKNASWFPSDRLSISRRGLGPDGGHVSYYDGWIQTKPLPLGLSWRPPSAVSVRVAIQQSITEIHSAINRETIFDYGDVYVRYSPDLKHWSSWQTLQWIEPQSSYANENPGKQFSATIQVPYRDRAEYGELLSEYSTLDVPWSSDEEAAVRWILKRDPDFFSKHIPFIGYVEFLFEGSFYGGQRIQSLRAEVSYGMGGLHSIPRDKDVYKDLDSSSWRFKAK